MKKILVVDHCKALTKLREKTPLTEREYEKLLELVLECPIEGMPFNTQSQMYPLEIQKTPIIRQFSEDPYVVSVTLRWNSGDLVSVIGDRELETAVLKNPKGIIFAVGRIYKRIKENRTYLNLRPRGWILVLDKIAAEEQKRLEKSKAKKK